MKMRTVICLAALSITALLVLLVPPLVAGVGPEEGLPGAESVPRQLLRVWVTSAPGGGMRWLEKRLTAYEKVHPGTTVYVRQVTVEQCLAPDGPGPDVLLFMPGELTAPETILTPISAAPEAEEALLRCGRWQGRQYAVPLCWAAWVVAVDSAWDDVPEQTPQPTTLLGRPAPTPDVSPSALPGYPLERADAADIPLLAPGGSGMFTLAQMLPPGKRPTTGSTFGVLDSAGVYQAFRGRKCASALVTTGQVTALESAAATGRAFAFRTMVPEEIITDQVWLAGAGSDRGGELIGALMSRESQRALAEQGLYGVDGQQALYTSGFGAQVEAAARRGLTAINAFIGAEKAAQAAWQAWQGSVSVAEALRDLT